MFSGGVIPFGGKLFWWNSKGELLGLVPALLLVRIHAAARLALLSPSNIVVCSLTVGIKP